MHGNLHEIVIVRTNSPLCRHPDEITDALNSVVGGRILLRAVQRTAAMLEEWVRYPPAPRASAQHVAPVVAALPDMGLAGDWCAHTRETTVFGIVAAPSWHSDVYEAAAQFASSWSPPLRLWNRRLQKAMQAAVSGAGSDDDSMKIRSIDWKLRQHLSQMSAEELCATLAHRQFLDQLLKISGVGRLQDELKAQLDAAERLIDWSSERGRRASEEERRKSEGVQRSADARREKLLGLIAVFGIFELGGFLTLANATNFHEKFFFIKVRQGVWEDWLLLGLFVLTLSFVSIIFGAYGWLRRWWRGRRGGGDDDSPGRVPGSAHQQG
jgi:hypothetical protein